MFRLPAMKFLQRKDSGMETVKSSAQWAATSIDDKPAVNTGRAVPLPLSRLDRRHAGNSLESQPRALPISETTEPHELLAPVVPTQQTSQSELAAPRIASDAAEIEHTWPIITPGAQYVTGNELQPVPESAFRREIKVEPWPYSSYRSANIKLRKPLPPALDTEFQPASTQSVPVPPLAPSPPAATSAAAVPPLLPPSP
ncbi:MAG: hypothetical protein JSS49_07730 [Planctomycetes bacterium]|nr:hypothetical protein [Planctomycetota bacterium]